MFRTRAKCPGISSDLGLICNQHQMIGRVVTLAQSASVSEVSVCLDGNVVGQLDATVGNQVTTVQDRVESAVLDKVTPSF